MKKVFDSKIFKIIYMILKLSLVLIIAIYLTFVIVQRLTGNKSIFGYRVFNVATGSMAGVYDINDVIAVKDCDPKTLKVGDDIAYKGARGGLEGLLITHRIIKIENSENGERMITTQGVASPVADPSITGSQVLGKVVGTVPIISPLNHLLKTQVGFFVFIFCPLVLVIVLEILQTITEIRIEKNEIKKIEKDDDEEDEDEESEKEEVKKKDDKKEDTKKKSEEEKDSDEKTDDSEKEKDEEDESEEEKDDKEESKDKDDSKDEIDEEDESEVDDSKDEKKSKKKKDNKNKKVEEPEIVEVIEDDIEIL